MEATCHCLLAQAKGKEEDDRMGDDRMGDEDPSVPQAIETLLIEEFSRCLQQIIGSSASKVKGR